MEASGCSSAPFIGGRGGGGEGAAVAARRTPRPALMAVGAGSALCRSSIEASSGLRWRVAGTAAAGR